MGRGSVDPADGFEHRLTNIITSGYIATGLSIGHKFRLFEQLGKLAKCKEDAVTSSVLAASLSLKERYIREWINGMVCADIVEHVLVDGENRYWIEKGKLSGLLNVSPRAELFTAAVSTHTPVECCFPLSGPPGTKVDDHPEVHSFLAARGGLFDTAADVYKFFPPGHDILSKLESGIDVLEIGCGAAHQVKVLATVFPKSRFTASDLTESTLARAQNNCKGLENVSYQLLDACSIPEDMEGKFDFVVLVDVFHDVPYPDKLASGLNALLKPGGTLLLNDIGMHESVATNKEKFGAEASCLYMISLLYCVPTSIYHPNGAGLGACVGREVIEKMLSQAGFTNMESIAPELGLNYLATKSKKRSAE